ncbi:MAG: aminoacyl-tRNA hydrolase [Bacteroidales bacterium]|nr:aminoacyl-tRNA hydrolase [Bacteroidales bacterium]
MDQFTEIRKENLIKELEFKATRSGGPGGQHVNKVSTRIELRFDINNSVILSEKEKFILTEKLGKSLTAGGYLIIVSQEYKSQYKNKEKAKQKFLQLLQELLKPEVKRKPSRPSIASKEKRLDDKRLKASKKEKRQTPGIE